MKERWRKPSSSRKLSHRLREERTRDFPIISNFAIASFPNLYVIPRDHSFDVLSSTTVVAFDVTIVFAIKEKDLVLNELPLSQLTYREISYDKSIVLNCFVVFNRVQIFSRPFNDNYDQSGPNSVPVYFATTIERIGCFLPDNCRVLPHRQWIEVYLENKKWLACIPDTENKSSFKIAFERIPSVPSSEA